MVAKHMRCSVFRAMQFGRDDPEGFDQAFVAAVSRNRAEANKLEIERRKHAK